MPSDHFGRQPLGPPVGPEAVGPGVPERSLSTARPHEVAPVEIRRERSEAGTTAISKLKMGE